MKFPKFCSRYERLLWGQQRNPADLHQDLPPSADNNTSHSSDRSSGWSTQRRRRRRGHRECRAAVKCRCPPVYNAESRLTTYERDVVGQYWLGESLHRQQSRGKRGIAIRSFRCELSWSRNFLLKYKERTHDAEAYCHVDRGNHGIDSARPRRARPDRHVLLHRAGREDEKVPASNGRRLWSKSPRKSRSNRS